MITLLLTAVALSMDAGAVSICIGIKTKISILKNSLAAATWFAFFQGLMTFLGYAFASSFLKVLFSYGKYFAFIVLIIIGLKMIIEAKQCKTCSYSYKDIKLFLSLAIATSIDAFAIGMAYSLTHVNLLLSVLVITLVTFIICFVLCLSSKKLNSKYQNYFEIFGGVVLILLAFKQLL